ncbi:alpha/beta hydrolase [Roseibium sp. HPY-6]|uniref:alpha/beta hydrolase n=1 Tax=Roseibium sp. HPY-6 TaxID=3229852 RepID=UPI00338E1B12
MNETTITDWDDAYANAAHIPGAEAYPPKWAADAGKFRSSWADKDIDVSYGNSPRQCFDLFFPKHSSRGLVVFVHGGYWLRFDKSYWSHFAQGALERDWTVCLPSYDLSPDVEIAQITRQIGSAIQFAAKEVEGPIRLSGHSAGGHLVTRMVCQNAPVATSVLDRVEAVLSISGLHDLRPLRNTSMNASFKMSEDQAIAESAALTQPAIECAVTAWVGAQERPEFVRQSELLSNAWPNAKFHAAPGKHHFDVIDDLLDADSELTDVLLSR